MVSRRMSVQVRAARNLAGLAATGSKTRVMRGLFFVPLSQKSASERMRGGCAP